VHARANATDLVASDGIGNRREDVVQCNEQRCTPADQHARQSRKARGERVASQQADEGNLHQRGREQMVHAGAAPVRCRECDRQQRNGNEQRPTGMQRRRRYQKRRGGTRKGRLRPLQQLGESREHEENEDRARNEPRCGEQDRIDRG